ncbi:hypothetical protein E5329_12320 [Petralouisia muris]|jgi:hypothetical protein|uniref:Uncharacterized protein n=1 Tax=Petralouisia muris TaxID=3032872 RepID=A0AC61RVS0_9FIRM|nr:hypothetical protein [Petralouisia muris]TGY95938.1 hypothetical protein E5329_12320 [Petralouisia muris]
MAVSGDQKYNIRYTFTAVGKVSKSGTSAKNAVSLKKGKIVKDLLFPNKYHYFKINLSKKSKVTLNLLKGTYYIRMDGGTMSV